MERSLRRPPNSTRVLAGAGVVLAATIATAIVARMTPADSSALVAASVAALGTLAGAAVGAPIVPYSPRAYWTGTALLAAAVLASAIGMAAGAWRDQVQGVVWMGPWFLVLLGMLPAPTRGACAPDRPTSSALLVGTAIVLGLLLQIPRGWPW